MPKNGVGDPTERGFCVWRRCNWWMLLFSIWVAALFAGFYCVAWSAEVENLFFQCKITDGAPDLSVALPTGTWVIIAEVDGKAVIHAVSSDPKVIEAAKKDSAWLGNSYQAVEESNAALAKQALKCSWMEYNTELEREVKMIRSFSEWEATAVTEKDRPVRIDARLIPHKFMGVEAE